MLFILILPALFPNAVLYSQNKTAIDSLNKILEQNIHDTLRVSTLLKLSDLYENYYSKAIVYAKQALSLSKKIKYRRGREKAQIQVAVTYLQHDKYDKSLEAYLNHIKYLQSKGDTINAAYMNINIGIIYYRKNEFDNALKYLQMSLGLFERLHDSSALGAAYSNIQLVQLHRKNIPESKKYGELAYKIYKVLGNESYFAGATMGLAEIYFHESDLVRASQYYEQAKELYQKINDEYGYASVLMAIADVHLRKNEYGKAIETLKEAEDIIRKIDIKVLLKDCYAMYAQVYSASEDYKKAYEYVSLLTEIKDSLLNSENMEKLNQLQVEFDTEKKEQALKLKESELRASKNTRNGFIAGFSLLFILCCVAFYSYRASRKANKTITQQQLETKKQKELVEEKQKEILDSIKYAKRIQQTLMPSDKMVGKHLNRMKKEPYL